MWHERWANKGIKVSKEGIGCVTCTQITGLSLIFLSPLLHLTVSFFSSFSPSALSLSVLETLFLKLKQKHTLGAYLILSTHTHTWACSMPAYTYTPTYARACIHTYMYPSTAATATSHTYMPNHNSNTLSWAHTYTIWNGMKDLWQAVNWFTTCCISMLIIFNAYKWQRHIWNKILPRVWRCALFIKAYSSVIMLTMNRFVLNKDTK